MIILSLPHPLRPNRLNPPAKFLQQFFTPASLHIYKPSFAVQKPRHWKGMDSHVIHVPVVQQYGKGVFFLLHVLPCIIHIPVVVYRQDKNTGIIFIFLMQLLKIGYSPQIPVQLQYLFKIRSYFNYAETLIKRHRIMICS